MNKDIVPENFGIGLALFDGIPVILFSIAIIIIGLNFNNILFISGAILCFLSGTGKVIWKILVALFRKNIWILFFQMRIIMPCGFIMMVMSILISWNVIDFSNILIRCFELPICIIASLCLLCIGFMFFLH